MTTYSTGNPIGSKDPRDLYDNAENLDEAVNTRVNESWGDRFGVARKTWWGMEQDFQQFLINSGYENIGDYGPGLEITARNQIFWRDGELYRAGAALEFPYTTTGDWGDEEGLFVAVGDAALRQQLADASDPGNGAAMIGYQGGTVADRLSEFVSVKEKRFAGGAKGDGVTDDTAAFVAAAAAHKVIFIPEGDFVVSRVDLSNHLIVGSGAGKTRLIQTGAELALLNFSFPADTPVAVTADVAPGTQAISVGDTSGFSSGDIINLYDNTSYAPTDAGYKNGELLEVSSVDATTIYLKGVVRGTITRSPYLVSSDTMVRRINTQSGGGLRDISLVCDDGTTTIGALFTHTSNSSIENVVVESGGSSGLRVNGCWFPKILGCSVLYLKDDIPNGFAGYGVAVSGPTEGCIISGNSFTDCRHGVTTMGGSAGYPHNLLITGNVCSYTSLAAIDTHAAGDGVVISNNLVENSKGSGITSRAINVDISGNTINGALSHGIAIAETNSREVRIHNNVLTSIDTHGIAADPNIPSLSIKGNRLSFVGADGIRIGGQSTNVVISDNEIIYFGVNLPNRTGIIVLGSAGEGGWLVQRNFIDARNVSVNRGIQDSLNTSHFVDNKLAGSFPGGAITLIGGSTDLRNDVF